MKKPIIILLLCCLCHAAAFAQGIDLTKDDALFLAQREFNGSDVDYYILDDGNENVWKIFVDAEPMKGWLHDAFYLEIPKMYTGALESVGISKLKTNEPPLENYQPLLVKNRYLQNGSDKPVVAKSPQSVSPSDAAVRTYALIISGGISKVSNYERYWNDCSFIYQTLVNKYGVPKDNIIPIMSDGSNPAEDMKLTTGGYASQPLDLDNDGLSDISISATKENVSMALLHFSTLMSKDDQLFIFVIDHGGFDYTSGKAYICLWNNERLYDDELADMLTPFSEKLCNINVVLGQCYSGGFNEELTKLGCVVSAASAGNEFSWACPDIPFDEFVYQWTCAMNEADHFGVPITSDIDGNLRVTVEEAFQYAKTNDRISSEHPQYVSTPLSVGEDLAFNYLAPSVDVYVKDNPEDTGKEINISTTEFWKSPSICVRNQRDSIFIHENPECYEGHYMAFIYVRIYNRGKERFTGRKYLHMYWSDASTAAKDPTWKGAETNSMGEVTGGHVGVRPVGEIEPGEYIDVEVWWKLPEYSYNEDSGERHFCLLAKITDNPYDEVYNPSQYYFNLHGSNKQCQKNVTIVKREDLQKLFNVYVRNVAEARINYTLELKPATQADEELYSTAKVKVELSPTIYSAWQKGGCQAQEVEMSTTVAPASMNSVPDSTARTLSFISPQSKIQAIQLEEKEFDLVKLRFDFDDAYETGRTFTYDLVQRDADGNIIGGETFIIEAPTLALWQPEIRHELTPNATYRLSVDLDDYVWIRWKDANGSIIGTSTSVEVIPIKTNHSFTVEVMTTEGEIAKKTIELDVLFGIKSAIVSADRRSIAVELYTPTIGASSLRLVSSVNGGVCSGTIITDGATSLVLPLLNVPSGVYTLVYIDDVKGIVLDSQNILIGS